MITHGSFGNYVVHQGNLEHVVRTLFEGETVLTNVRKDASIKNPTTGQFLEIDVWLPNLKLCFEFQDAYHYVTTWTSQKSVDDIQVKDSFKHDWLRAQGQTVAVVPCWWDGAIESLRNTVKFIRPELFDGFPLASENLISFNASYKQFKEPIIPDIGELMLASFPSSVAISDIVSFRKPWWLGEKYDGLRACWHPKKNILFGRYGVPLEISKSFLKNFGPHFLDGEVWLGRGTFVEAQKILTSVVVNMAWELLRILVFDDPSKECRSLPFEGRYANVNTHIPIHHPFLIQAYRILARTGAVVARMSREIIESGGEGIVLRQRGSLYTSGRSPALLKLKAARGDKEGLVTNVASDGSIVLQLPDGSKVTIPRPEVTTLQNLKSGDIVTFTYEFHSRSDVPINLQITRTRRDLTWRDVLRDHASQKANENDKPKKNDSSEMKPSELWVAHKKRKNMRLFFENYARAHKFDPLIPKNWHSVSAQSVMEYKEGNTILSYFNKSLTRALKQLFPEVRFDEKIFGVPQNYWKVVANRRKFFIDFAKAKKFDPLVAHNWYSVSEKSMTAFRGGSAVAHYYGSSLIRGLIHLFPEIRFNLKELPLRESWRDIQARRAFFEKIASDRGFDPLVASNWYSISFNSFAAYPGANTIRKIYGGFKKALLQLFPKMRIEKAKFVNYSVPTKYWRDRGNTKEFFETFAKEKGFDSLKPENWYAHISKKSMVSYRGGVTLMKYYGGFGKALLNCYPDIGLDPEMLPRPANYWANRGNRRSFFEKYASEVGFDPLVAQNWYSISKKAVMNSRGGNSLLVRYANSTTRALLDTFPEIGLDKSKFGIKQKSTL